MVFSCPRVGSVLSSFRIASISNYRVSVGENHLDSSWVFSCHLLTVSFYFFLSFGILHLWPPHLTSAYASHFVFKEKKTSVDTTSMLQWVNKSADLEKNIKRFSLFRFMFTGNLRFRVYVRVKKRIVTYLMPSHELKCFFNWKIDRFLISFLSHTLSNTNPSLPPGFVLFSSWVILI